MEILKALTYIFFGGFLGSCCTLGGNLQVWFIIYAEWAVKPWMFKVPYFIAPTVTFIVGLTSLFAAPPAATGTALSVLIGFAIGAIITTTLVFIFLLKESRKS